MDRVSADSARETPLRPFPSSGRRLAGALTALALSVPLAAGLATAPAAAATVWTPYDPPLSGSTLHAVRAVAAGNGAVSLGGTSATASNRAFVLHRTATGRTTTHPPASAGRLRSLTYSGDRLVVGLARPAGTGDCGTARVAEWTGTAWTGRAAPLARSEAVELTGIPGGGLWAAATDSLDRSEHLARSTP